MDIQEKAKSMEQQHLMGMAYAVRKGKLSRDKVPDIVLELVDGKMTDKQLKDFASTTKQDIEDAKENEKKLKNESLSQYLKRML